MAGMILENKFERYLGNERADRRVEEILEVHERALQSGKKPEDEAKIDVYKRQTYGCPAYTRYEQQLLGGEKLLKNRCRDMEERSKNGN